eukprot:1513596-Rhodomonas_salina.2
MSSTPRFHGYPLSHFAHAFDNLHKPFVSQAAVSEQGRKAENVANRVKIYCSCYIAVRLDSVKRNATDDPRLRLSCTFGADNKVQPRQRPTETFGDQGSFSLVQLTPGHHLPQALEDGEYHRRETSPKIKTLKYDMYHGKDPALGGGAVAASRRRRRFGGVGPPGEAKDSISPLKPAHGSDLSNPQTPCKTPAKSTFSPATPELERRPQSEQRPRKTPTKETLTPRPPTAPAPTKVVIKGPLTSFEEVVRAAKADAAGLLVEAPPPRTVSCPNPSVCVHTGNIMPSCWSPVLEPRPEDVDPARTFEHAGKVTGIRRPNTARPTYHREKPRKLPEDLNDVRSQMMYTGSAAFVPARRNYLPPNEDEMKAKRRENRQQLLGKHIIHRTLEKNKTLVHYSYLYYQAKKITKDATTSKGIGTVVDWDPDGLMTHVRWQDGSVEYCCTGFSGFYFLALLEVTEDKKKKETEKEEIVSNVNFEDLSHYPAFWINEQGISRMAAKPGTHHRTPRDIAQTRGWITRLNKLLADAQGNRKALLTKQLERAEADLTSLLHDRRIMTAGMVCKIGDKETVLRPSTLAPAGFVPKAKKVTILEEVKRLVRREAEKERRRRREEEELKRERRRLERKMLKKSRDVEHLEIAHKVRLERKMMDPWTAIITANEQQLGHILHQTFTLFDLDLSGWIDVHEFEQAMDQMGLHGQSEILEALLLATDVDRSGHIDFREFQHLALSLIEARKHVKEQERHRNEKVRKAKRREAAGFSSISESDMTEDEAGKPRVRTSGSLMPDTNLECLVPEEEQTMLEKAVAASSLLMKDVEGSASFVSNMRCLGLTECALRPGVDAPPQRKRRVAFRA